MVTERYVEEIRQLAVFGSSPCICLEGAKEEEEPEDSHPESLNPKYSEHGRRSPVSTTCRFLTVLSNSRACHLATGTCRWWSNRRRSAWYGSRRCEDVRLRGPFCSLPAVASRCFCHDAACIFSTTVGNYAAEAIFFAAVIQHACSSPYSQSSVIIFHLACLFSVQAAIQIYPLVQSLEWARLVRSE